LIRANNHIRTATTRRGSQYGRLANTAAEAPTAITQPHQYTAEGRAEIR
jgi:hypothetical protein